MQQPRLKETRGTASGWSGVWFHTGSALGIMSVADVPSARRCRKRGMRPGEVGESQYDACSNKRMYQLVEGQATMARPSTFMLG